MRVQVGPVPSQSARVWIAYARQVLATERAHDAETLPEDLRGDFGNLLDQWEEAASRETELRWEADADPEVVQYLVHGFYRVATRLAEEEERQGGRQRPEEGDEFYWSLVEALLDAMAHEGAGSAEFAEHLRGFWPGLDRR